PLAQTTIRFSPDRKPGVLSHCLAPMTPADAALWENGTERPIRRHFAESPIIGIADVEVAGSIKCNLIRIVQLSRCRGAICADPADPGTGNRNWSVTRRDFENSIVTGTGYVKLAGLIHCHSSDRRSPGCWIEVRNGLDHSVPSHFANPCRTLNKIHVAEV